jgi:hypothetical protein
VNEVLEGPLRREPVRDSLQDLVETFGIHRGTEATSPTGASQTPRNG